MENNKIGRKERERLFRKQEIISAAIKLFAQKGYEHTTLDEIAEASEFGKGTIYNYFQSKEEIYLAIVEDLLNQNIRMLKQICDETDGFIDFITRFTKASMKYSMDNYDAFLLMVRVRTQVHGSDPSAKAGLMKKAVEENKKLFFDKINKAIANKEIKDIDPQSLLNVYRSLLFPYIHFLLCDKKKDEIDPEKEAEFVLSILFNGILL